MEKLPYRHDAYESDRVCHRAEAGIATVQGRDLGRRDPRQSCGRKGRYTERVTSYGFPSCRWSNAITSSSRSSPTRRSQTFERASELGSRCLTARIHRTRVGARESDDLYSCHDRPTTARMARHRRVSNSDATSDSDSSSSASSSSSDDTGRTTGLRLESSSHKEYLGRRGQLDKRPSFVR